MSTILDGSIAILHGSKTNEVSWVWLSPKHGAETLAHASTDGFWVRDHWSHTEIERCATEAKAAWLKLRAGEDVADLATHHLVPPYHNEIAALPAAVATR